MDDGREALRRVTAQFRENHKPCYSSCPWAVFWEDDADDLYQALADAGWTLARLA